MKSIKNIRLLIKFAVRVWAVNRENGSHHRYVNKIAQHEISRSHQINDGSIQKLHFLKIQWYMATNLYLGELLAEIRPQSLTKKEKQSLIYLGALMAITDLMLDDHQLGQKRISHILSGVLSDSSQLSAIEKIFVLYHEKLLSIIDNKKAYFIRDFSMRKPQIDSQKQMADDVSEAKVHELTRNKGGTAVLLTASLLIEITDKNESAFYQLGAFIQYLNDSQDAYKDIKTGIKTYVCFYDTFDQINERLKLEFNKTVRLLQQSGFESSDVYRLLFYLQAMLVGVAYKNLEIAKITGNRIKNLYHPQLSKKQFSIKLFSPSSLKFCIPKIICFENPAV